MAEERHGSFQSGIATPITVREISDLTTLDAIAGAWRRLQARDPDAGVYLSWNWMRLLFAENPGKWKVLAVGDVRAPDGISALLPLRVSTHWSRSQNRFESHLTAAGRLGMSEYTGFVCEPALESDALTALAGHMATRPWARLSLRYEPTERRLRQFAEALPDGFRVKWRTHFINKGTTNQLLCPQIALPDSAEIWQQTGPGKNARKRLRQLTRRHLDTGELQIRQIEPATFERDIATFMNFWEIQWSQTLDPEWMSTVSESYRTLLRRAQQLGLLHLPMLWQDDRPLGGIAGIVDRDKGAIHIVVSARDLAPDLADVGLLLHSQTIGWAIGQGFRTYDFGHGNEDYKYTYGAKDLEVAYLSVSRRGETEMLDPLSRPEARRQIAAMRAAGDTDGAAAGALQLATAG